MTANKFKLLTEDGRELERETKNRGRREERGELERKRSIGEGDGGQRAGRLTAKCRLACQLLICLALSKLNSCSAVLQLLLLLWLYNGKSSVHLLQFLPLLLLLLLLLAAAWFVMDFFFNFAACCIICLMWLMGTKKVSWAHAQLHTHTYTWHSYA